MNGFQFPEEALIQDAFCFDLTDHYLLQIFFYDLGANISVSLAR